MLRTNAVYGIIVLGFNCFNDFWTSEIPDIVKSFIVVHMENILRVNPKAGIKRYVRFIIDFYFTYEITRDVGFGRYSVHAYLRTSSDCDLMDCIIDALIIISLLDNARDIRYHEWDNDIIWDIIICLAIIDGQRTTLGMSARTAVKRHDCQSHPFNMV